MIIFSLIISILLVFLFYQIFQISVIVHGNWWEDRSEGSEYYEFMNRIHDDFEVCIRQAAEAECKRLMAEFKDDRTGV